MTDTSKDYNDGACAASGEPLLRESLRVALARAERAEAERDALLSRFEAAEARVRELEERSPPLLGIIGDQRQCVGSETKGPAPSTDLDLLPLPGANDE